MMREYFLPLLGEFDFHQYLKHDQSVANSDVTPEYCAKHNWIIGSPSTVAEKIAITRKFEAEVWPKLADGRLQPIIDRIFPIAEAQAAHAYVLENRNIGKVILEVGARG